MAHYWILIFSSFGVASPQFVNPGDPQNHFLVESTYVYPPVQYLSYLNLPFRRELNESPISAKVTPPPDDQRKRRNNEVPIDEKDPSWSKNSVPAGKDLEAKPVPYVIRITTLNESTDDIQDEMDKRSFSPWGGKRMAFGNMYSWKRSANLREPNMPKRVRFSPWGGKRSGQMIYKGDNKKPKTVFAPYIPDLTRIVSNYPSSDKLNIAGVYFTPNSNKRNPIKVLPLDTLDEQRLYNEMPLQSLLNTIPKLFRPGQTFANVFLKKDGKRKFKFSSWGGKRSPPIIGPIWAPTSHTLKEKILDSIVLIRNPNTALKTQ